MKTKIQRDTVWELYAIRLRPYLWANLPEEYTFQNSLSKFKEKNN